MTGRGLTAAILSLAVVITVPVFVPNTFAGPPYLTDDPEPVTYQHWEIYLASLFFKQPEVWTGTAPHLEVNYGLVPNI